MVQDQEEHVGYFDILHQMGFKPSKADADIWMKSSKHDSHYEYIAVYVDGQAICMKDPQAFCDTLKEKYKLKLKGDGPVTILDVDIPEMKMEPLFQIQGNTI